MYFITVFLECICPRVRFRTIRDRTRISFSLMDAFGMAIYIALPIRSISASRVFTVKLLAERCERTIWSRRALLSRGTIHRPGKDFHRRRGCDRRVTVGECGQHGRRVAALNCRRHRRWRCNGWWVSTNYNWKNINLTKLYDVLRLPCSVLVVSSQEGIALWLIAINLTE